MRKSLLRLMLGGLAIVSAVSMANAQTLTLDWSHTTDIPAAANARWGTGFDGKVWTNDKSVQHLIYWDETGKTELQIGTNGTAISVDDAGNILINSGFPNVDSSTAFQILPAGGDALQPLTVTMPANATAGRMDFMGRANGNILSEEGGAIYLCPQNSTAVAKIFIASGVQVPEKSKSFAVETAGGSDGVAQPLDNNPENDNYVACPNRTLKGFIGYTNVGANSTAAGDVVTLNGVTYSIEPTGTDYCDGFQIVDRSTDKVVATHEEEYSTAAARPNQNALTAEKVDEYTANIYQYVPGQLVAKYTFSLPKPVLLEARNAYAYDIKVEQQEGNYVVSYRLNAPASQVKVQLWADGEVAKEYDGTTIAQYTDENKTAVNNLNTVTIPAADVPEDTKVSFRVAVTSEALTEAAVAEKAYRFYHPAGVAIDNNTDSPYFGRLYMTEAMPSTSATYHSYGEGNGQGLYIFDQMLNPVTNAEGSYAFKGGQTFQEKFTNGTTSYDPRKVRITEDGRVLLSGQNENGVALWEVNPEDLNADFKPIISGTPNGYDIQTADGQFMAAPNVSMDVKGKGSNLKVLMLSNNNGGQFAYGGYRTDEYDLGTATEWTTAPSRNIAALSGKYTITHTNTTVLYDNEGGIWYANSRATATADEPTLVHINAAGEEDYKVEDGGGLYYGGGGIAFNHDFTRLAIGTGSNTITVYAVSKDADGKPVLTEEFNFETTIGRNCNDIAWDIADNLYIVGNNGEWLKSFSLPRESGEVVVAAPSKYDISISSDEYPAELFIIGGVTDPVWSPETGIKMKKGEEGVYTAQITTNAVTDNIGIVSVLDAEWETVNANRWGFENNNATVTLNKAMPIVKGQGAICIGAVGTFDVTVDLKNMTILVEGEPVVEYPETLYIIGNVTEDVVFLPNVGKELVKDADANVYRAEDIQIYDNGESGYGYFAFVEQLGADEEDWNTVNANRFGPAVSDTEITDGVAAEIGNNGDTSYKVKAGIYDFVVDLDNGTITITEKASGVDEVEDTVAVVAGRGEIRIVGEPQGGVSIYNMSGQAIAVNSNETTFNVASGIYIVAVDGKTVKVMVR